MKKMLAIIIIGVLAIGFGAMSFADTLQSPAEVYADLTGVTVAQAYTLKGTDKTFGELAEENGVLELFMEATMAGKILIVEGLVGDGTLAQEDADAILNQLAECDGTGEAAIGSQYNLGFGQAAGYGTMREDAPRYGGAHAGDQLRARDTSDLGGRYGQNR